MVDDAQKIKEVIDEAIENALYEKRQEGLSELEAFKTVALRLLQNALQVLRKVDKECQKDPKVREDYYLLQHYLDYLRYLCQKKQQGGG